MITFLNLITPKTGVSLSWHALLFLTYFSVYACLYIHCQVLAQNRISVFLFFSISRQQSGNSFYFPDNKKETRP